MASELKMPQMGFDMREGTLVRWLKGVGDEIAFGDVVAEVETDKSVVEFESTVEGTVVKLLVEEGSTVPVGEVLAMVAAEGEDASTLAEAAPESSDGAGQSAEPEPQDVEEPAQSEEPMPPSEPAAPRAAAAIPLPASASELRASPVARKLAAEKGIDLSTLQGSGPGGRIVREDVLAAETSMTMESEPEPMEPAMAEAAPDAPPMEAATPAAPAAPAKEAEAPQPAVDAMDAPAMEAEAPQPVVDAMDEPVGGNVLAPLSRMRRQIARVTLASKTTTPHFYVSADIDMTESMSLRRKLNKSADDGVRVSVNDMVIKACVNALQAYPRLNARYTDAGILMQASINVGIAIAVDEGLIMPAVVDCGAKSLVELSAASKDLIKRSQSGSLKPEEYTGGTFSISNMGMFDVTSFAAIIQPPQSAVLAVGSVRKRPAVVGDQLVVREMLSATLSVDHRVSDGAEGAQFIVKIKSELEDPLRLLL